MAILFKLFWLAISLAALAILYVVSVWLTIYWSIAVAVTVKGWFEEFLNA